MSGSVHAGCSFLFACRTNDTASSCSRMRRRFIRSTPPLKPFVSGTWIPSLLSLTIFFGLYAYSCGPGRVTQMK